MSEVPLYLRVVGALRREGHLRRPLQGYLAHKKQRFPMTLQ